MSDFERRKDQIQEGVQSTAGLVGRMTVIVTDAIAALAREVGDWVTDGIEMREAARASRLAESRREGPAELDTETGPSGLDADKAPSGLDAEQDPPER